jgi:hypothetical protein
MRANTVESVQTLRVAEFATSANTAEQRQQLQSKVIHSIKSQRYESRTNHVYIGVQASPRKKVTLAVRRTICCSSELPNAVILSVPHSVAQTVHDFITPLLMHDRVPRQQLGLSSDSNTIHQQKCKHTAFAVYEGG